MKTQEAFQATRAPNRASNSPLSSGGVSRQFSLLLGLNMHNIRFTIFTISECTAQWQAVHLHCRADLTAIQLQNVFHLPKLTPVKQITPHFPSPQPLETIVLSIPMNLPTLTTSSKWSHTIFAFCLVYFTSRNIFRVHVYCRKYQNFIPS